ncbi:nucleoside hydrolase, partial [Rhodococcus oxybenzonivorans]
MSAPTQRLIVDVDTGIDDSLALLYLLASPEAEILGIASTAGNVPVEQVAANNLNWLGLCRAPDIEVALGARVPLDCPLRTTEDTHGPQGIGYAVLPDSGRSLSERDATTMWVELVREHPGEVTGLVTGPLTNLALAIRAEPELPRLLHRLVVMGGAYNHPGNTTPTTEWNVSVDPEAA